MSYQISIIVDVGDKVINVHTGEVFVVEQVFRMRKINGGEYTPNNTWSVKQILSTDDWKLKDGKDVPER